MKPYLIAVEGLDRSGKSTFIEAFKAYVEECGYTNVVFIRDPPPDKKPYLYSSTDLHLQAARFSVARAETSHQYKDTQHVIITDRWAPSTFAYQNVPVTTLQTLQRTFGWLPIDTCAFVQVSYATWCERMKQCVVKELTERQILENITCLASYSGSVNSYLNVCDKLSRNFVVPVRGDVVPEVRVFDSLLQFAEKAGYKLIA
jgi:thymidylate kinase